MNDHENKDFSVQEELNQNDCYPDRKTIRTINDQEGEIFLIDNTNFGITCSDGDKPLLPCNLPASLQKAGKKIIFAGIIKETKLEELWAGEPFVLLKIAEKTK